MYTCIQMSCCACCLWLCVSMLSCVHMLYVCVCVLSCLHDSVHEYVLSYMWLSGCAHSLCVSACKREWGRECALNAPSPPPPKWSGPCCRYHPSPCHRAPGLLGRQQTASQCRGRELNSNSATQDGKSLTLQCGNKAEGLRQWRCPSPACSY